MAFSARVRRIDELLREIISIGKKSKLLKQVSISDETGIDERTLKAYAEEKPPYKMFLATNEFLDLVEAILAYDLSKNSRSPMYAILAESVEKLRELGEYKDASGFADLTRMIVSDTKAGDPADFRRLCGVYFVFRRTPAPNKIMVSALEIKYNSSLNLGEWNNVHRTASGSVPFAGVITESDAVFHFVGTVVGGSTLHSMSLIRPESSWSQLTGVVLTKTNRMVLSSRVVVQKVEHTLESATALAGEMALAEAQKLAEFNVSFIDNSCESEYVLEAKTDF